MKGFGTMIRKEFLELWGMSTQNWLVRVSQGFGLIIVMGLSMMSYAIEPFVWQWGVVVFLPAMITLGMMMFTGESFVGERERHTLESLLAAPVSEHAVLLGKVLAHMVMGVGAGLLTLLAIWLVVLPFPGGTTALSWTPLLYSVLFVFCVFLFSETLGVFVGQRASTVAGANAVMMPLIMTPWVFIGFIPAMSSSLDLWVFLIRIDEIAATAVGWAVGGSLAMALVGAPFILRKNKAHRMLAGGP